MNNILEMIKNENVEWKKLGDNYVSNSVTTGLNPRKNFRLNDSSDGELTCWYITTKDYSVNEKIEFVEGKTAKITENARIIINKRSKLEINDILFSAVGTVGKVALVDINPYNFDVNESTFVIKPNKENIIPKFLVHYLRTDLLQNDVKKFLKGSTLKGIRKKTLLNLQIPIPSLKTQEKIVETLDKFEKYSTELQNRSSQYEYFRDLVLSKDYLIKLEEKLFFKRNKIIEIYKIKDLCKRQRGIKITAKEMEELNDENSPVKVFAGGNTSAKISNEIIGKENIINEPSVIVKSRGNIDFEYYDKAFTHKNEMWSYSSKNENVLNIKFLYYVLKNNLGYFVNNAISGKLPQISTGVTDNYKILLPSIEIQNKVVEVLDKFQDLISDAEGLLPEEIEQRQKQYECYREKLLTFENNMEQVKSSSTLWLLF